MGIVVPSAEHDNRSASNNVQLDDLDTDRRLGSGELREVADTSGAGTAWSWPRKFLFGIGAGVALWAIIFLAIWLI